MTIRVLAALGLAAILGGAAFAFRDRTEPTSPTASALPVDVITLEQVHSYAQEVEYTGTILAAKTSELGFERPGKLVELSVDDGAKVSQGDVLARLDTRQLEAQRAQLVSQLAGAKATLRMLEKGPRDQTIAAAKARVRSLRSNLGLQERNYTRRAALASSNAVSAEELDQTRFASRTSQAQLDEATEQLKELLAGTRQEEIDAQAARVAQLQASLLAVDVNLEDSALTASFDGVVTARYADEGTVVNVGQAILRVVDSARREAHIGVPPEVGSKLMLGKEMSIVASGVEWTARLRALLPELNPVTRTQTAVFEILPQDELLPVAGELARATVKRNVQTTGFWVPSSSLERGQRGLWAVLALEPADGSGMVARRRDVEVLFSTESRALVRGALSDGDQIVASGTHRLVPGQAVTTITGATIEQGEL